jgi:hypothetical protein
MRILESLLVWLRGTPADPEQVRRAEEVRYEAETAKGAGPDGSGAGYSNPIQMDDLRPPH